MSPRFVDNGDPRAARVEFFSEHCAPVRTEPDLAGRRAHGPPFKLERDEDGSAARFPLRPVM